MTVPGDAPEKDAFARLFSATSVSHDAFGTPLFAYFGERLVELVDLRSGQRVLDVAAGVGATLVPAARRVGERGRVIGVDLAPGMVRRLATRVADEGLTNAEVAVADGEALPYEDRSFDAVLCGFALFFFADPMRAVEGLRRVLRPGGVLGASTFSAAGSASMDRIWEHIARYTEVPPPPDPARRFDDAAAVSRVLADAGLVDIDVRVSPLEAVYADIEAWWGWLWSMEFREPLARLDPEEVRRFKASAAEDFALSRGSPRVGFRMDALLARCRRE